MQPTKPSKQKKPPGSPAANAPNEANRMTFGEILLDAQKRGTPPGSKVLLLGPMVRKR